MLGFLYSKEPETEGVSRALVVDHYTDVWRGKSINLSVGAYIKGKSIESLYGRKHEIYSLKSGWSEKQPELKELIDFALKTGKETLKESIKRLSKNLKWGDNEKNKGQERSNFIKRLISKASQIYFNNSETLMRETLRRLDFEKIQEYKSKFCALAKEAFEEAVQSYEHNPKFLKAIEQGRRKLYQELAK